MWVVWSLVSRGKGELKIGKGHGACVRRVWLCAGTGPSVVRHTRGSLWRCGSGGMRRMRTTRTSLLGRCAVRWCGSPWRWRWGQGWRWHGCAGGTASGLVGHSCCAPCMCGCGLPSRALFGGTDAAGEHRGLTWARPMRLGDLEDRSRKVACWRVRRSGASVVAGRVGGRRRTSGGRMAGRASRRSAFASRPARPRQHGEGPCASSGAAAVAEAFGSGSNGPRHALPHLDGSSTRTKVVGPLQRAFLHAYVQTYCKARESNPVPVTAKGS
jgi:hypothetical protein